MDFGVFRRSINNLANESIKENMLNKIPPKLKDRLDAEGGDITFHVEKNLYTISGCSKTLADEIDKFLREER